MKKSKVEVVLSWANYGVQTRNVADEISAARETAHKVLKASRRQNVNIERRSFPGVVEFVATVNRQQKKRIAAVLFRKYGIRL